MAEKSGDLEARLSHAREQEKHYDWRSAAESYEKALDLISMNDPMRLGEILEKEGYSLHKAAMQSEGEGQFRELTQRAIDCYVRAEAHYDKSSEPTRTPFKTRAEAMVAFLGYWKSSVPTEKKALVREAWRMAIQAMKGFEGSTDPTEFIRTFNQLTLSAAVANEYADDFESVAGIVRNGLDAGEKAIKMISARTEPSEIARAHANTCAFLTAMCVPADQVAVGYQHDKQAMTYWHRAVQSSEESALSELASMLVLTGLPELFKMEQSEELLRKAVEHGRNTHDRLLLGMALGALAGRAGWGTLAAGDSDEFENLSRRALQFASEASSELSKISFLSPGSNNEMWVAAPEASVYGILAYQETDAKKKREFAEKAVRAYPSALKLAQDSEYPYLTSCIQHRFGYSLTSLAKTETDKSTKKDLLEKAIELRKASMTATTEFAPFSFWDRGSDQSLLAEAEFELATVVDSPSEKSAMLHDAISRKKDSLDLHFKAISLIPPEAEEDLLTSYPIVGHWLLQYSAWLEMLYELEGDRSSLVEARDALGKAAEMFTKREVPSRAAECQWKAAQICIDLDEHAKASDRFEHAAEQYKKAAEKVPRLKEFFLEYQSYMKAWVEIEQARHHYARHQSGISKEHYENAAELLESTKKWGYLSPNYRAWGEIERAEQLSRDDSIEKALDAFHRASDLFSVSRSSLTEAAAKIDEPYERTMTDALISAAEWRKSYCEGRAMLEEARLLGRKGDLSASADKFDSATHVFHDISEKLRDERDRKEIQLIATLSKAWHAMTKAEAEASARFYADASRLFEEARDLSSFESEKLLLMGHSKFCRALAAGIEFEDNEDPVLHSTATQQLDSAAKYYLKAGNEDASEYANGSKLLFDAYMFMSKARREDDLEKKTKLYVMAEKVLQASGTSFEQSRHMGKRNEVFKLLSKVKRDRELAVSLGETFKAPDITSSTAAFSAPIPTYEKAIGVERFEHADIQATLVAKPKDLHIGQEFNLDIELVNAGRGSAQLTKVEETVPKGFVVVQEPEKYRMEDSLINLRGRRLDALKTEDVKLVLKPTAKGNFRLNPRIKYLDDSGTNRTCEPTPVEIVVREMGIAGWIRGT